MRTTPLVGLALVLSSCVAPPPATGPDLAAASVEQPVADSPVLAPEPPATPDPSPTPSPTPSVSPTPSPTPSPSPSPTPSPTPSPSPSPTPSPSPSATPVQTSTYGGYECDRYADGTIRCPTGPDLSPLGTGFLWVESMNGFACAWQDPLGQPSYCSSLSDPSCTNPYNSTRTYCWNWFDTHVSVASNTLDLALVFPSWSGAGYSLGAQRPLLTPDGTGRLRINVYRCFAGSCPNMLFGAVGTWDGAGGLR